MNNRITRDELNTILDEELQEFPGLELPVAFTDRLISRLEKRLSWRELFFEFALKTVLAAGALAVLAGVLLFPSSGSKSPVVNPPGKQLADCRHPVRHSIWHLCLRPALPEAALQAEKRMNSPGNLPHFDTCAFTLQNRTVHRYQKGFVKVFSPHQ